MRTFVPHGTWRRWSVVAVGAFLCGVIVSTLAIISIEWTLVHHLQFAIPILLALAVVAYGGWLVQSELSTKRILRIAIWSLAGIAVVGSFSVWEMYIHILEGERYIATLHELMLAGTEGAIVGGGIGYYDAQRREQLRETKRAQQAISAAIDGIALLDEEERYTDVNQAHAKIYGYDSPETFIGESWRMCYPDAELERVEEEVFPELMAEGHWRGELTGLRRNGDTYPQELSLTAMDDGGLVCVVRDISEQKRRVQALEEAEGRFRALTDSAEFGVVTIDEKSTIQYANTALAKVLGYRPEELEGKSITTLMPERFRDDHRGGIQRYLREDTRNLDWDWLELPGLHRDGYEVPLGITFGETQLEDGSLFTGIVRDITEQTERENQIASLHEASRQLTYANTPEEVASVTVEIADQILDKSLSGMWLYDEETNRLMPTATADSSQEFLEAAGVTELSPIGDGEFGMDVFRNGELTVIENYDTVENPTYPDLPFGTVIVIPIENHGILGIGADTIDEITETERQQIDILALNARAALDRAQREQALTRRKELIESLHGVTRDMVGVADVEEICELAVDAAQRLLDVPNAAIWINDDTGRRLEPVTHSRESVALLGDLPVYTADGESLSWQAFERGETRVYEDLRTEGNVWNPETPMRSEIIVPLGEYGVMNFGWQTSHAIDETDVRAAEMLGASTVTALERTNREQKLETQLDRMEFFNSILRHDVLNGMTVIRGRAEFLIDELDGDQLRDAETILDWSDDTIEIVQRVRTTLDTLTGEGEMSLESVGLSATLRDELGRVRDTYPDVTFETTIPDAITVQANELLGDVFGNIITNAMNHNEIDGLSVSITATEQEVDNTATVRIADNGNGIPDEAKESIFRRHATGHAKSSGSGFGLFFVDTMINQYGGDVWVEDNDAGGATFVVELPLAKATTTV